MDDGESERSDGESARRADRSTPGDRSTPEDVLRLVREERLAEAADLAASRGDARAASELYERACAWGAAAEQAALAGDAGRALVLAVLGKDDARAAGLVARVAASASATDAAHAILERRGEAAWDARVLEAAGRNLDAARAWDRAGEPVRSAGLLERAGDVAGAARVLEAAVRGEPRADALVALGALLLRFGKTEAAVRSLQRVPGDAKERRRALALLARAFDALGLSRARVEVEAELTALGGPEKDADAGDAGPAAGAERVLFGRYRVIREVASSPSARVVECTDPVRGEHVAVKIFAAYDARGAGRDALARFEREVRVLARLDHPNVVPLRDYVPDGPAIVLAWMSGGTLDLRIADGRLTPARAVEIACALLSALGEAHRLGVLHRDVKPTNVLFDDAGVARLGDFGASHMGDLSATATAGVIGTLAYMSPEQREGKPATAESDVYGVGAVLYEMLTGERPRRGSEAGGAAETLPSGVHRDLHPAHDEAVLRLLARDPGERPHDAFSARSLLSALRWPDTVEPAVPRSREQVPSVRPQAGRADLSPDGTGVDRWIERRFEHVPLDARAKERASAFARAGHPALQAVLRVDRDTDRIWLKPASGRPLAAPLTAAQLADLRAALDALHAAGIAHGHVDRAHVLVGDDGAPLLRFAAAADPTATPDRDRLALARLAEPAGVG